MIWHLLFRFQQKMELLKIGGDGPIRISGINPAQCKGSFKKIYLL